MPDPTTPERRPSDDLRAAAAALLSAAEHLEGAVGTPPSGYPITRVLGCAREINAEVFDA
jgi:hypothetical protein